MCNVVIYSLTYPVTVNARLVIFFTGAKPFVQWAILISTIATTSTRRCIRNTTSSTTIKCHVKFKLLIWYSIICILYRASMLYNRLSTFYGYPHYIFSDQYIEISTYCTLKFTDIIFHLLYFYAYWRVYYFLKIKIPTIKDFYSICMSTTERYYDIDSARTCGWSILIFD